MRRFSIHQLVLNVAALRPQVVATTPDALASSCRSNGSNATNVSTAGIQPFLTLSSSLTSNTKGRAVVNVVLHPSHHETRSVFSKPGRTLIERQVPREGPSPYLLPEAPHLCNLY